MKPLLEIIDTTNDPNIIEGIIDNTMNLFDYPHLIPQNVRGILADFAECEEDPTSCQQLNDALASVGFTIDYDLGGTPQNLHKIKS